MTILIAFAREPVEVRSGRSWRLLRAAQLFTDLKPRLFAPEHVLRAPTIQVLYGKLADADFSAG